MTTIIDQALALLLNDTEITDAARDGGDVAALVADRLPALLASIQERNAELTLGSGYVASGIREAMIDGIAEEVWMSARDQEGGAMATHYDGSAGAEIEHTPEGPTDVVAWVSIARHKLDRLIVQCSENSCGNWSVTSLSRNARIRERLVGIARAHLDSTHGITDHVVRSLDDDGMAFVGPAS